MRRTTCRNHNVSIRLAPDETATTASTNGPKEAHKKENGYKSQAEEDSWHVSVSVRPEISTQVEDYDIINNVPAILLPK